MKALENQMYLIGYLLCNIFALVLLMSAWKGSRLSRLLFLLLFAWACWLNFAIAFHSPETYIDFDELAVFETYKKFISGWFSHHIQMVISFIAACQGLIAISMALKGWIYRIGLLGGIVFFVSIAPFGIGSAFPCTLIMAIALAVLWQQNSILWKLDEPDQIHKPKHAIMSE